jgi:hypothetical protein
LLLNNSAKNFGFVDRNKIYKVLKKSKAALASEENFFSLFVIDSINCNLKIISFNDKFYNRNLKLNCKSKWNVQHVKDVIFMRAIKTKIMNINMKIMGWSLEF